MKHNQKEKKNMKENTITKNSVYGKSPSD
jgi:hypothetical protein